MKKLFLVLFTSACSLIKAQTNFDNLYRAIEIPFQKILNIDIDGKLDEWNWIPDPYKYRFEDCLLINESLKKTDFYGYFSIAWGRETNWIYFIASVKDDIINVDTLRSHYFNDKIELAFNFGDCSKNEEANPYFQPKNLVWFSLFCNCNANKVKSSYLVSSGPDWIIKNKRYAKFNCSINKTKDGKYMINYELGMSLWENISKDGPEYSKEFVLKNNKKLKIYVSDRDYDRFLSELKHTYIYYGGTWCTMPLLNLDPFISSDLNQNNLEKILNLKIE